MKYCVVTVFHATASMSWPDAEKANVFRKVDFDCTFESPDNEPAARAALLAKQNDQGAVYGLVKEYLKDLKLPTDFEPVDREGNSLEPIDFVARNAIAGGAAMVAFWGVVNRDVEAKKLEAVARAIESPKRRRSSAAAPADDADSEAPAASADGASLPPAAIAFFRGNARPSRVADVAIEVLKCNWLAVQVYLECQWTVGVGMEAIVWLGVSATETLAALRILCVPRAQWADTRRRVRIMVDAARPILNKPKKG